MYKQLVMSCDRRLDFEALFNKTMLKSGNWLVGRSSLPERLEELARR